VIDLHRRWARISGFTLIEVMVVISILAILAALIVPKVMSRPDEARVVAAKTGRRRADAGAQALPAGYRRYLTTEQGLQALVARPGQAPVPDNWKAGGYVEKLPLDPWGKPYQYLNPGLHGEIDVFSYGADGIPGGEGFDADVGNWSL
jgi:general secretion pathway protein G